MTRVLGAIAVLLGLAGTICGQTTRPVGKPTHGDELAAGSLLHSASELRILAGAPTRARRLVLHLRFAKRLVGDDPWVNHALANVVYAAQRRPGQAGKSAELYLRRFPNDYAQGLLWLDWSLGAIQTATARAAWLDSVINDKNRPAALRAEAASMKIDLLAGQGLAAAADKSAALALKLDPYNVSALTASLATAGDATPVDRASLVLALAAATAGQIQVAQQTALLVQSLGLHSQALFFHKHVWDLTRRAKPSPAILHAAAVRYCNALIDAGQADSAIKQSRTSLARFADSIDLRLLLIEALQLVAQNAQASEQQDDVERALRQPTGLIVSESQSRQLAMFYLVTRPKRNEALRYARRVGRHGTADVVSNRILAAAKLASGDAKLVDQGRGQLEKLIDSDIYAAAMLAEYYAKAGRSAEAKRAILAGAAQFRTGPAWRWLASIAAKQKVALPPVAGAEAVGKLLARADNRRVAMAAAPNSFISLAVRPVRPIYVPGEGIEVEITLRNISQLTVPIGVMGLIRPSVALRVAVGGAANRFDDLPAAVLPAPRYLKPGSSVRHRVRLDVGSLASELARRPLEDLTLTVTAIAAPYQYGDRVLSGAESIKIAPVSIIRKGIMGDFPRDDAARWPAIYNRTLGLIVRDMKHVRIEKRMLAARQVASLLTMAREIEMGRARAPRPLHRVMTKPVLLTMLREVLKDRSDVVRAEMLVALGHTSIDRSIISQLSAVFEDPSPLVRYRLAELLGATAAPGAGNVIKFLATDRHPLVSQMAKALTPPKRAER